MVIFLVPEEQRKRWHEEIVPRKSRTRRWVYFDMEIQMSPKGDYNEVVKCFALVCALSMPLAAFAAGTTGGAGGVGTGAAGTGAPGRVGIYSTARPNADVAATLLAP